MIRVLHVLGGLGTGGTENLIMNWYRNIDREKIQFDFLVRNAESNFVDEIKSLGGRVFYTSSYPAHAVKNYLETRKILEKREWDVIHVHANAAIYMTPLIVASKCRIPCRIMHSHSVKTQKSIYSYIHYCNRRLVDKHATVKLACSQMAGEWMYGKKNYEILKNGLDIEKYLFNIEGRKKVRDEFNIHNKFVVGHVGRFSEVKNHSFLLRVFKEIKKRRQDSVLLLTGDGELEEKIRSQVVQMGLVDSVLFTGKRSDIGNVLSAMDTFVFPSLFEGLGNVLIEAQVNGLPCYASLEVVVDEVKITSHLFEISLSKNEKDWAEYILSEKNSFESRYRRRELFQHSGYDIKDIVNRLENIYSMYD